MNQIEMTNPDYISFSQQDPSPPPTGDISACTSNSCFGNMNGHAADNRKKQVKKTPLQVCYPCFKPKKKKYSDEAVPYSQNYGDRPMPIQPKEDIIMIRHRPFEQDMQMSPSREYNAGPILQYDELLIKKNRRVFRETPLENVEIKHFEQGNFVKSGALPKKTGPSGRLADYEYSETQLSNGRILKTPLSTGASLCTNYENRIKTKTKTPNDAALPVNDFPNALEFEYKFNPWFTDELDEMIRAQPVSLINSYSSSLETDKQNAWVDDETETPRINAGVGANELTIPSYSSIKSPSQNHQHKKISWQSDESISFMVDLSVPIPQITKPIEEQDERNGGRVDINLRETNKHPESVNVEPMRPIKGTNDEIKTAQSKYIKSPNMSMSYTTPGHSKEDCGTFSNVLAESEQKCYFLEPLFSKDWYDNQDREYSSHDINKSLNEVHSVRMSPIKSFSNLLLTDKPDAPNRLPMTPSTLFRSTKENYPTETISDTSDYTISYMLDEVDSKSFIKKRSKDISGHSPKVREYYALRTNTIPNVDHLKLAMMLEPYSGPLKTEKPHAESSSSKSNDRGTPNGLKRITHSKENDRIEKIRPRSDETISFAADMLSKEHRIPIPIHNRDDRHYEFPLVDSKTSITLGVEYPIDIPSPSLLKDESYTRKNVNDLPTKIGEQNAGLLYNPRPVVKPSESLKNKANPKQVATPINIDLLGVIIDLLGGMSLNPDFDNDDITAYNPHQKNDTSKPSKKSTNSIPKSQSLNNVTRHVPNNPNSHKTKIPVPSDRGTYIGPITQSFKTLPHYRAREKRLSGLGNDMEIEMTVIHEQASWPPIPKEIPVAQPKPPVKQIKNEYCDPEPKDIPKFQCEPVARPECPPFHPNIPKFQCEPVARPECPPFHPMFNAEDNRMSRKTLGTFGNEIVRNTFPMFCKNDFHQSSKENYDVHFQPRRQDCIVVQSSDHQLRERVKQFDRYSKHGYRGHRDCDDPPNNEYRLCGEQAHTNHKRQDCSNNSTIKTKSYRYIKDVFGVNKDCAKNDPDKNT